MGGSLEQVLVNITMAESEKVIVTQLIENNIVKFYVDDTLLALIKKDIAIVRNKVNSFNKNLKFTVDTSEYCVPHFLDIKICPIGLGIYQKIPKLLITQILNLLHCGNEKHHG